MVWERGYGGGDEWWWELKCMGRVCCSTILLATVSGYSLVSHQLQIAQSCLLSLCWLAERI